jgi:hypothetical protein
MTGYRNDDEATLYSQATMALGAEKGVPLMQYAIDACGIGEGQDWRQTVWMTFENMAQDVETIDWS